MAKAYVVIMDYTYSEMFWWKMDSNAALEGILLHLELGRILKLDFLEQSWPTLGAVIVSPSSFSILEASPRQVKREFCWR